MKVMISGGAGFIGFHLARFHADRGDSVIILDNFFKTGLKPDSDVEELRKAENVVLIPVDLTKPINCQNPPQEVDIFYHLAAINGTQFFYDIPYQLARANLLMTLNLLDWLQNVAVGCLVYTSTSEVYAGAEQAGVLRVPTDETVPVVFPQPTDARFSYGTSKFMGEFLCAHFGASHGVPTSIIRYHNIYGPRMGVKHVIPEFILRLKAQENPFGIYGGSETRAFCYIDDAVRATFLIAATPQCHGEIIHVGNSNEEIPIRELALLLMDVAGERYEIRELGRRSSSVSRRCPNTAKLERLTGYRPQVALREGLERTLAWYLRVPSMA